MKFRYLIKKIIDNPDDKDLFKRIFQKIKYEGDGDIDLYRTRTLNQLVKFAYEVKKGDIIVIPNTNSYLLSIGEVTESPIEVKEDSLCEFRKRKHIRWIKKDIDRFSVIYKGFKFLQAHYTLTNINEYSTDINILLYDFYIDQGIGNLVLNVKKESKIGAFELGLLYFDILDLIEDYSIYCNEPKENIENISIKLQLTSPGVIILTGVVITAFTLLALATIIAGGEANVDIKKGQFRMKSNSLLDKFNDYMNSRTDRKLKLKKLAEKMKNLEFASNQTINNLIKSENKEFPFNQDENLLNDK